VAGTVKLQIPPSQEAMRNRTYNCQMRNLYYEKSNYQFRKLKKTLDSDKTLNESELLPDFHEFAELLNVCLSYARASISRNKSNKMQFYAQDHFRGILQEEILLSYFLEQQLSSVKFIISYIETNVKIQNFANKGKGEVTISHILSNINELNQNTKKNMRYIYDNIEKRYTIGNKLFGVLQELQSL
jgi:hypothetical protein